MTNSRLPSYSWTSISSSLQAKYQAPSALIKDCKGPMDDTLHGQPECFLKAWEVSDELLSFSSARMTHDVVPNPKGFFHISLLLSWIASCPPKHQFVFWPHLLYMLYLLPSDQEICFTVLYICIQWALYIYKLDWYNYIHKTSYASTITPILKKPNFTLLYWLKFRVALGELLSKRIRLHGISPCISVYNFYIFDYSCSTFFLGNILGSVPLSPICITRA